MVKFQPSRYSVLPIALSIWAPHSWRRAWVWVIAGTLLAVLLLAACSDNTPPGPPSGTQWTSRDGPTLTSIAYGKGRYVAVRGEYYKSGVMTSSDGLVWAEQTIPIPRNLFAITYGNNQFVAAGECDPVHRRSPDCTDRTEPFPIFTSSDGVSWIWRNSGLTNWYRHERLYTITYGNNKFVAAGYGGIIIDSTNDGVSWRRQTSGIDATLRGIIYHRQFVVVGSTPWRCEGCPQENSVILTSPAGVSWTLRDSTTTNHLHGIAYGNGAYIAVGASGTILRSANGATWASVTSGTTHHIHSIIYANTQFVAVGNDGTILTSPDGTSWTRQTSGTEQRLLSITYGNNLYVAGGGLSVVGGEVHEAILTAP